MPSRQPHRKKPAIQGTIAGAASAAGVPDSGWVGSLGKFDLNVVAGNLLYAVLVDTPTTPTYYGGITEEGGGPVEMISGSSDCNIHPTREVIDC
jgi:hypothetical protein